MLSSQIKKNGSLPSSVQQQCPIGKTEPDKKIAAYSVIMSLKESFSSPSKVKDTTQNAGQSMALQQFEELHGQYQDQPSYPIITL